MFSIAVTYFKVKILIADIFIFYVKKNETS